MDYGQLLSRAWNTVWEQKFLILLGVLVVLTSGVGGTSGGGSGGNLFGDGGRQEYYNPGRPGIPRMPEMPRLPQLPQGLAIGGLAILVIGLILIVVLLLWALSTVARGGLIAGANTVAGGGASSFGQAFGAALGKAWRLLGIALVPAIPALVLGVFALLMVGAAAGGLFGPLGRMGAEIGIRSNIVLFLLLLVVLGPIALALGLLRTFANRACMIEDRGVINSYRRGARVLLDHIGPALVLFVIQIGVSIGVGIVMLLPALLSALCCLLWPLFLLVNGTMAAFFSTMWTLAWRDWTDMTVFGPEF